VGLTVYIVSFIENARGLDIYCVLVYSKCASLYKKIYDTAQIAPASQERTKRGSPEKMSNSWTEY
jgi:hypothetical protein